MATEKEGMPIWPRKSRPVFPRPRPTSSSGLALTAIEIDRAGTARTTVTSIRCTPHDGYQRDLCFGHPPDAITYGVEKYIRDAGYSCDVEYRGLDWSQAKYPQIVEDKDGEKYKKTSRLRVLLPGIGFRKITIATKASSCFWPISSSTGKQHLLGCRPCRPRGDTGQRGARHDPCP